MFVYINGILDKGSVMNTLAYKRNTDEVIERLRSLYARQAQDRIFARFDVHGKVLEEFNRNNPEGYCPYPDPKERIAFWDRLLEERMTIDDDSVPSAYLSEFDQGLYGGLLGGDVQYMCHDNGWISSMIPPLLKDWAEAKRCAPFAFISSSDSQHLLFVVSIFLLEDFPRYHLSVADPLYLSLAVSFRVGEQIIGRQFLVDYIAFPTGKHHRPD